MPDLVSVDLFAGGGGASEGIALATGRAPIVAVNHCPAAIDMHRANHPATRHHLQSVWDVSPRGAVGKGRVDLLWASPDCFAAGTLVLTAEGYRAIEEVEVGTMVLTHRNRWRRVVATMSSLKPAVRVFVQGHPDGIVCSASHRHFAARSKMGAVERVPANELGRGSYIGTPLSAGELALPGGMPDVAPWVLGRYVADGWAHESKGIVLTVGDHKAAKAEEVLSSCSSRQWSRRKTGTATQFTTYDASLARWLRVQFGHLAPSKRLPGWLMAAPEAFRREFLQGYADGDGYQAHGSELMETSTVSRELALGLRTLAGTLGYTVSAYHNRQHCDEIQGRKVHVQQYVYSVKWRRSIEEGHCQQWDADGQRFYPVRKTEEAGTQQVFNITVEEDHSYVVEGLTTWNCTHFSRAKGGKPRKKEIRALAMVIVEWARSIRPRVICMENVPEFTTWGPLDDGGQPIKAQAGDTFRLFVGRLRLLGYRVEWQTLVAADYGAPTIRKRLFLVARCDGEPIVWPEPTHGPGCAQPWRAAAECIDWDISCPSIFTRTRPLAEATQRRIAEGIRRYVIESPTPFIVSTGHQSSDGGKVRGSAEPLSTIVTKAEHCLVAPTLIQTRNGERKGQAPRTINIRGPLNTITAQGSQGGLVTAFLAKHYGGPNGHPCYGQGLGRPMGSITGRDSQGPVAVFLDKFYGSAQAGQDLLQPMPTVTAGGGRGGGHAALVAAFLLKYYGSGGQWSGLGEPMHTIVSKARFGLVTVAVGGEPYVIADIGLRMLQPRELARAQGFPDSYILTGTKSEQIARIGNSVCPPVVEALVRAQFGLQRRAAA